MSKNAVIYAVWCSRNARVYVGQARNAHERWGEHRYALTGQRHHNRHLQGAWNLYGADCFSFVVLQGVDGDIESVNNAETLWIDSFKSSGWQMFNLCPTGWTVHGRPVTEKTRAQISATLQGHYVSPETVEKIRAKAKGRPLPLATREKLRGKKHSEATRAKMSASRKGRKLSEGTKAKLRGRTRSLLHRSRLAESNSKKWKFISPEGGMVEVTNLALFCRRLGLHRGHMSSVFRGYMRQHKGWTRLESEEEKLGYVLLTEEPQACNIKDSERTKESFIAA